MGVLHRHRIKQAKHQFVAVQVGDEITPLEAVKVEVVRVLLLDQADEFVVDPFRLGDDRIEVQRG